MDNQTLYSKNNSKVIKIICIVLLLLIVVMTAILMINFYKQKQQLQNQLLPESDNFNIKVIGFEFDQPFSKDNFSYNLEINTEKVQFDCSVVENVKGCNQVIDLKNVSTYDHTIEYMTKNGEVYKYKIHIIKKIIESSIIIDSIEKDKSGFTNSEITITVNATSTGKESLKYSFDGGNTWQTSNKFVVKENQNINVIVKDETGQETDPAPVVIDTIDNVVPTVDIIIKDQDEDKIVLFADAKDNLSGVDLYSWNGTQFSSNSTYEVTKAGVYTVSVRDKAKNISKNTSINIPESAFNKDAPKEKYTYQVEIIPNGATIDRTIISCSTYELSCKVKLPEITRNDLSKDETIIVGYAENADATIAKYKSLEEITISEDKKLYAITAKKVTVTFNKNGVTSLSKNSDSCAIYSNESSCKINTPTIVRDGWTEVGFASTPNAKTGELTLTINKDATYYAITKKPLYIKFSGNGATLSKTTLGCNLYNTATKCAIITPTITRNGWSILGFAPKANATSATVKQNASMFINTTGTTYYAITKKALYVKFDGNGATVSKTTLGCNLYNTATKCAIITPTITRNGWSILGFAPKANATSATVEQNTSMFINATGLTYYAITARNITVSFNANGGINAPSRITKSSLSTIKLPTAIPTKIGYKFLGWSTSPTGSVKYKSGATYTDDSDITLYAKWQDLHLDNNSYSHNNTTSSNQFLFNKINQTNLYNYAPSAFEDDDGTIHIFYVGNTGTNEIVDHIYHRTVLKRNNTTGYYYSNENTVLEHSSGKWDSVQVCDPTVIKGNFSYNGVTYKYLMVYLGVATYDNSLNQIGLAVSNNLNSTFKKVTVNSPFISYPANSIWGVGQPTAVSLDGNGLVMISYTQGLTTGTGQVVGIYDLSNLNKPTTVKSAKSISTKGAASYISNADIAIDLTNDLIYCTAHKGNSYETNSVTGTVNYIPSQSMILTKKLNLKSYNSLSDAVYSALTTSNNSWTSNILSSSNYLIHNTGFIRDPYGYVNGVSNMFNSTLISTAQKNGNQTSQLWSYQIRLYQ